MARPREFVETDAISDAMDVFWAQGYEGASISTLLHGMGLTKGSLYKAFTDKRSLFLKAMSLYEEQQVAPAITILTDLSIENRAERIERVFRAIPITVRNGDRRGCMLCSAAAGPAADDDGIAKVVEGLLGQMKDGFEAALDPTLSADKRSRLASFLVGQYTGLRILARAQTSVQDLEDSVTSLLDLLEQYQAKS